MQRGILIDTQVLIWMARDPKQLGRSASRTLREHPAIHFSSISIAELQLKQGIGKFTVADDLVARLEEAGLSELSFTSADAAQLQRFPTLARHDPFDRFIMAQAASRRLALMTADRVLLSLGLDWILNVRD